MGDTVVLPEGTFDLRSCYPAHHRTHVLLRSGVHLRGAGAEQTVLVSDFDGDDDSTVLLARGVEDIAIADLTLTSTYDGPFGTDPDDDTTGGGPMFGIMITERDGEPSARMLVENVNVERFQRHGISLKATRQVTVRRVLHRRRHRRRTRRSRLRHRRQGSRRTARPRVPERLPPQRDHRQRARR